MWNLFRKKPFTKAEEREIVTAIQSAERTCSGEIRLFVESHCKKSLQERTVEVFKELKMHRTAQRNGVLIYVAIKDHRFAIFGDEGIHRIAGFSFWEKEAADLKNAFQQGNYVAGICQSILDVGEVLKEHFPPNDDDKNELSDKPVYGK